MKPNLMIKKIIIAILLGASLLAGCSGINPQATPTPDQSPVEDVQPIVSATGKVTPDEWSRLSFSTAGLIQEILFKEGDQVKSGDVLVRMRGIEDLQAAISAAEFDVITAQKALDDLNKNAEDTRTAALERISEATKSVRDAQYQLDNFTVPSNQSTMSTREALAAMEEKLDAARAAFEPYKYYPSTNNTREDLKEDLDDAQADFNSAVKRLQYETDLEVARIRLAKALKDYETWREGPDPAEIAFAEARLATTQSALAATQSKIDDLELKAPFSGTISDVDIRIGEWVTPGQPVLLIADLDHLQIETTDLNEIDAARVQMDDQVSITFDALPGIEIQGVVHSIAPKSSEGSGVNYTVVILMDEIPAQLRWGMTAFVDILVE